MNEPTPPLLTQLESFRDVLIPIEVRIGPRTATVHELASITDRSIVLLDKRAGETLDLFAGNVRLASVEVVVLGDRLAVRITEFDGASAKTNGSEGSPSV